MSSPPTTPLLTPVNEVYCDINEIENRNNYNEDLHVSQNKYSLPYCAFCKRRCKSRAGQTNHEKKHVRSLLRKDRAEKYRNRRKERIYTCKECYEEFMKRSELNSHKKKHNISIKCLCCQKTFKDRSEYELQHAINEGLFLASSDILTRQTRSQSRLMSHCESFSLDKRNNFTLSTPILSRKRKHSYYESDDDTSNWSEEDDEYFGRISQGTHSVNSVRSQSTLSERLRHGSVFDGSVSPPTSSWSLYSQVAMHKIYICGEDSCLHTFTTLNWITKHEMDDHGKLALFRCNECRMRFTTYEYLREHVTNNHKLCTLTCVLCDTDYFGLYELERHVRLHQKITFKCTVCSKEFLNKGHLDEHLRHSVKLHKNFKQTKARIIEECKYAERYVRDVDLNIYDSDLQFASLSYTQIFFHDKSKDTLGKNFQNFHLPWRS